MRERLRKSRRFFGLDLQGVSNQTGLRAARIARIESGHARPYFVEILRLARLY